MSQPRKTVPLKNLFFNLDAIVGAGLRPRAVGLRRGRGRGNRRHADARPDARRRRSTNADTNARRRPANARRRWNDRWRPANARRRWMTGGGQQMPDGGGQQMPGGGGSSPPTRSRMLDAAETLSATVAADAIGDYLGATGVGTRGRTKNRQSPTATTSTFSSTTQSSNRRPDGRTDDRWVFQAEYDSNGQLFFTRIRQTSTRTPTSHSNESIVTSNRLDGVPRAGWKGVETEADYTTGLVYWDAFSDIENAQDADYLTLGYWLIVFKDSNTGQLTGTTLGVSGGGSDGFISANLAGLTGTASYEGPATGVVMSRENAHCGS